jgi:stage III sporulation protein AC
MGYNMSVEVIIKIAALGIVVAMLNQILKHAGRDDQAFFVTMAGIVVVLTWILPYLVDVFSSMQSMFGL